MKWHEVKLFTEVKGEKINILKFTKIELLVKFRDENNFVV